MNHPTPPNSGFILITDNQGDIVENYPENSEIDVIFRRMELLDKEFPSDSPHSAWRWGTGGFTRVFERERIGKDPSDMLNDWKPFKVIEAGEFRNNKGEMEKFFYVVLQVPGFQTMEQFEGNLKECEEECNELNQRISASLSLHIQNQK